MLDSKGVISVERQDLNEQKRFFATSRKDIHTLEEAIKDADVFVGLSKGNVLSKDMVKSMAKDPVIFALANPVPEISYEDAMDARPDVLMSTGRTDYPNQINNVIGFPYIFRGALDVHATAINEEMKLAAVHAIADLAKQPVPDVVNDVYKVNNLSFGRDYFIPKPVDPRLITEVSAAVAKAAIDSGVARKKITNWEEYKKSLSILLGQETKLTQKLYATAANHPQRVVFAEAVHPTMLKAAVQAKAEGICHPILLGNDEYIAKLAKKLDLNIEGIEIVNLRHPSEQERRERYARILTEKRQREGYTFQEANECVIGRVIADRLGVTIGDEIEVVFGNHTERFIITGFQQSVMNLGVRIFISEEGAKRLGIDPNYEIIRFRMDDPSVEKVDQALSDIKALLGEKCTTGGNVYDQVHSGEGMEISAVSLIVMIMVGLNIAIILLVIKILLKTLFIKKEKEFGIKKALGFTSTQLRIQLCLSLLPATLIGSVAGAVAGYFFVNPLFGLVLNGYGLKNSNLIIKPSLTFAACIVVTLSVFVLSYIMSYRMKKVSAYDLIRE
jgi:ABC-type lipoprotein release transport system permease subunit